MLREDLQKRFAFGTNPETTRDKSGSTHQAITDAAVALAEQVIGYLENPELIEPVISELVTAVRVAHYAVEAASMPPAPFAGLVVSPIVDELLVAPVVALTPSLVAEDPTTVEITPVAPAVEEPEPVAAPVTEVAPVEEAPHADAG